MKRNRESTDDIQIGLEDMIRSIIAEWRADPKLFDINTMLKTIQYGGMFLTRIGKLTPDESQSGSAVRKYAGAFKTANVASKRRAPAGPNVYQLDTDTDPDSDDAA